MKIFMMGDSIMKKNNYYTYPQFGWGQGLELFLKDDINIINYAENGRSTKSFIDEGRFEKILNEITAGDYVICSFGHNDEKEYDEKRYTKPFSSYQSNLKYFHDEVVKKGGKIIFATSIVRHKFENNKLVNTHGDYPKAMVELCKNNNYECIDLNKLTTDLCNEIGEEESSKFYLIIPKNKYPLFPNGKDDHSHLNIEGAYIVSLLFVKEVNRLNYDIKNLFVDLNTNGNIDFKMLVD